MKLTIPRSHLKDAVAGLSKVVNPRASIPILACVRLDAEGKAVRLTGTDLNQVTSYELQALEPVQAPVSVLSPLDALHAVLKTAQGPDIEIAPGKDAVTIVAEVAGQNIGRRVETPDIKDWPELAVPADTKPVDPGFLASLRQALTFASADDSRPLLKSAYLDVDPKKGHRIVATDSRRLSVFPCGILPLAESAIMPSTKFLNWSKLEGETRIGAGKGVFTLRCGPWTYSAKTVEGQYPRWSQVVPAYGGDRTLELSPEDASMLIKALPGLPAYDNSHEAVVLRMEGNAVRVFSRQDSKSPESAIRLESSKHEGKGAFSVGLNREFFQEALQAGFRYWEFQDAVSPLLGRLTKDDKASIHVLMPIRTIDTEVQRAEAQAPEAKPAPVPVQPQPKEIPMPKKHEEVQPAAEPGALDKILVAYESAKNAVRQAQSALAAVALCVRDAIREQKAQSREIAEVRAGLAKLQTIRV
ncbi:MAG TPA: DNA polymerase III subunit beta [Bryobacteraceae bacterium]|nr:DNA polymerase III subunit beta [Bryobacteraceae bacterium]